MTVKQIRLIMSADLAYKEQHDYRIAHPGCPVTMGLNIMAKYIKEQLVQAVEHDVLYGPTFNELAMAGITLEDIEALRMLGWTKSCDTVVFFV